MKPGYVLGTRKLLVKYVDTVERERLSCSSCGWKGTAAAADVEGDWEERALRCPSCETLLGMVSEQLYSKSFESFDNEQSVKNAGARQGLQSYRTI